MNSRRIGAAKRIARVVCNSIGIERWDLDSQKRNVSDVRTILVKIIKIRRPDLSSVEIAHVMGMSSHASALNHNKKFNALYETNKAFREKFEWIVDRYARKVKASEHIKNINPTQINF